MAIETKPSSPESIPSVTAISHGSSNESDDDDDDDYHHHYQDNASPRRALFPQSKGIVENLDQLVEDKKRTFVENLDKVVQDKKRLFGSDISITSSDVTVVASWNLSPKNTQDQEEWDGSDKEDDDDDDAVSIQQETQREPRILLEDPEEQPVSCNGALSLTPKQLAEMFLVFEGAHLSLCFDRPFIFEEVGRVNFDNFFECNTFLFERFSPWLPIVATRTCHMSP